MAETKPDRAMSETAKCCECGSYNPKIKLSRHAYYTDRRIPGWQNVSDECDSSFHAPSAPPSTPAAPLSPTIEEVSGCIDFGGRVMFDEFGEQYVVPMPAAAAAVPQGEPPARRQPKREWKESPPFLPEKEPDEDDVVNPYRDTAAQGEPSAREWPTESVLHHAEELAAGLAVQGTAAEWLTREFIPSAIAAIRHAQQLLSQQAERVAELERIAQARADQYTEQVDKCIRLADRDYWTKRAETAEKSAGIFYSKLREQAVELEAARRERDKALQMVRNFRDSISRNEEEVDLYQQELCGANVLLENQSSNYWDALEARLGQMEQALRGARQLIEPLIESEDGELAPEWDKEARAWLVGAEAALPPEEAK